MKQSEKLFIFDFDGVICDSFKEVIFILNSIGSKKSLTLASDADINRLRSVETREIFTLFGIEKSEVPQILKEILEKLNFKINTLKPFKGIKEILIKLHYAKVNLGIVSSNTYENVSLFLQQYEIQLFNFIHTGAVFNKGEILKGIVEALNYSPEDIYYIGDETRDIMASREAGVRPVAVSWGFNDEELLNRFKPDFLVANPHQLLALAEVNN